MRVYILGSGKVGHALARAIRAAGRPVTLRAARRPLPSRPIDADLLIVAVRDRAIAPLAQALASRGLVGRRTACVHVAGALGPDALAALRGATAGVAQMHPMIAFASKKAPPRLAGGCVHVQGDAPAVRRARRLARLLGMRPRTFPGLDTVGYHAAAGLVANGSAALAAAGAAILVRAGVPEPDAALMLGALLRSVADNVRTLGFPEALTGPVRRGDLDGVAAHLRWLTRNAPRWIAFYREASLAQVPLARAISDAPPGSLARIERLLRTRPLAGKA